MAAGIERAVQFFSSPFLGKLSDSYGRKPVLLLSFVVQAASLIGLMIDSSATSILIYFILNGACNATSTLLHAMVTDWTFAATPKEGALAQQYGRFGMAIGVSFIVGPAVGPAMSKLNVLYPVYISFASVLTCIVIW